MTRARVRAVGVVVPARNEQELLPACLASLHRAAARLGALGGSGGSGGSLLPVRCTVVVVLDGCTDGSAGVVAAAARTAGPGLSVVALTTDVANVGAARARGVADVLRRERRTPPRRLWLATTDADSQVPPEWLTAQLALAAGGAAAVAGTVRVEDWEDHPPEASVRFAAAYRPVDGHRHDHGANMGFSAQAYLEVGGFPSLRSGEDVALLAALERRHRVVRTAAAPVVTSARRRPRAPEGFGSHLVSLADAQEAAAG